MPQSNLCPSPLLVLPVTVVQPGFVNVGLVDLTAAYDTVWLRGLHLKLLRMVPDVHMVSFVMELLTNRSFKLKTSDGQVSRLRRLRNGVPQGSTLSPTLFNIYISDIPQTTSMQYGYADDLALLVADDTWEKVEETLNHDMQAITNYLQKWRLILSTAKTTSTAFHLNNRDSQRQLAVSVNGTMLPNCEHPVYLGVTLDRTLTYKHHIEALRRKVNVRNGLLRCLAGSTWGAYTSTLRTGALALVYSAAEYASPVWSRSAHTGKLDVGLYDSMRIIREFSIAVNVPLVSGVERMSARKSHACIPLYMHYNTARSTCTSVQ